MKASIYNHYYFNNDCTLLYNYLSNRIGKIHTTIFQDILYDIKNGTAPRNDPLFSRLIQDGYFVDNNLDERITGNLKYFDTIYENNLDITILASEQCNFRCKYCYEDFKKGSITDDVINSFLSFMVKNVHKYSMISINWFGGEPLLAAEKIEQISGPLIELCRKTGKPYMASMTTNGYLLNADMMLRMLKCKITNYQITIDGTAESHNKVRVLANGGTTFDHIINNLQEIRDIIKSKILKIVLRTNISRDTLPEINNYIQLIHEMFEEDNRFECFFRPAGDWGGETVKTMKNALLTSFDELYTPLLANISKINVNTYIPLLNIPACQAGNRNSFVLGTDGLIYKCTMLFNEDFNKIGMLARGGKLEIDKNKLAQWIMPPDAASKKCDSCDLWPLCHNHTCPAKYFMKRDEQIENCGYERKSIDYILMMLDASRSKYINCYDEEEE